jgi:hypothetical protein
MGIGNIFKIDEAFPNYMYCFCEGIKKPTNKADNLSNSLFLLIDDKESSQ